MVKNIFIIVLCIMATMILAGNSFAGDKADGVYTVASPGSTDLVNTFKIDQKPWLFVQYGDVLNLIPRAKWFDPAGDVFKSTVTLAGTNGFWLSLSDHLWGKVAEHGEWDIKALAGKGQDKVVLGKAHFSVTPEPIGSLLFAIGAGALGIIKRRRDKSRA